MILLQTECNFNTSIYEEGNIPQMFFIMIKDFCMVNYIMAFNCKLNISIPNKDGITLPKFK